MKKNVISSIEAEAIKKAFSAVDSFGYVIFTNYLEQGGTWTTPPAMPQQRGASMNSYFSPTVPFPSDFAQAGTAALESLSGKDNIELARFNGMTFDGVKQAWERLIQG